MKKITKTLHFINTSFSFNDKLTTNVSFCFYSNKSILMKMSYFTQRYYSGTTAISASRRQKPSS